MANTASNAAELEMLELITGKSAYALPTPGSTWLALFTSDPGETGSLTGEVSTSGTAYARSDTTGDWGSASAGQIANAVEISFVTATTGWGAITHWAICDAVTAGNVLVYGALTPASTTVVTGDTVKFAIGALVITCD